MKITLLNLLITGLLFIAVAGCKKDSKKDDATKNYLKVDGTEYDISKGFIVNYGGSGSIYNIDLVVVSSGLNIHDVNGLPDSVSGTGNTVYFEMYSSVSDKISSGDYVYNDSGAAGSFDYEDYMLNWNTTTQPNAETTEITSGTVKVINSGTEYELTFSGKDVHNKIISGYYKGNLKYYDDSGKKKSLKIKQPWKYQQIR